MSLLSRLKAAARYLRNPGGTTKRSRLSRAELAAIKRNTTERLRREVTERQLVDAVARELGV